MLSAPEGVHGMVTEPPGRCRSSGARTPPPPHYPASCASRVQPSRLQAPQDGLQLCLCSAVDNRLMLPLSSVHFNCGKARLRRL